MERLITGATVLAPAMLIREDYIKRLIRQVGEALANALSRTGAGRGQPDEVLQRLRQAYRELGIASSFFDLEPASLRKLLGSPERVAAVAELCRIEAEVWKLKGDEARAERCGRLAVELGRNVASPTPR